MQIYYLKITSSMPMFDATHRLTPQPATYEGALRYAKMMQDALGHMYSVRLIQTNAINEEIAGGTFEKSTLPI